MSIELPINIALDKKFYPANRSDDPAVVAITALNTLQSGTYILPSLSTSGVLRNDGNGILLWDEPAAMAVDHVDVDDSLTTGGTFRLLQRGSGDSSLAFSAGVHNYILGIDQNDSSFKIAKGTSLGTSDMLIMNSNNTQLTKNDSTTGSILTLYQKGVGDSKMNFQTQTPANNYSLGVDAATNSFKISNEGVREVLTIDSTSINIGLNTNLLTLTSGEMSFGISGNLFKTNATQTTIGPNAAITSTLANVILGPNSALTTESTHVEVSKNFKIPAATSTGDQGLLFLGGLSMAFMDVPNNLFIGNKNTFSTDSECKLNMFMGINTASLISTGSFNMGFGHNAGQNILSGDANVFMGYRAGEQTTRGSYNTFIGTLCGCENTIGSSNTFVSYEAGKLNISGNKNVCLGQGALEKNTNGSSNIAIGYLAAYQINGSDNIAIGESAFGTSSHISNRCIAIGNNIEISDAVCNDRVCIGHGSTCEIDNGLVLGSVNTRVGICNNSPSEVLDVVGNIRTTGQLILVPQVAPPTPAVKGGLYFDSTLNKLRVCTDDIVPIWADLH